MNEQYKYLQPAQINIVVSVIATLVAALTVNIALASEAPDLTVPTDTVPEKITGVTTLTAESFIKLTTNKPDLIIIDARIADDRRQGYIEGSISLPDIEANCTQLGKVIPKKVTPVMFYCNGIKCERSMTSVKIAKSCQYKNIYWFRGGFKEWKDKGFQYVKDR